MSPSDKRLIEDYLPIQAISAEASREKGLRKGNISTLHIWWARRPLAGCRSAVFGALASVNEQTRARESSFLKRLCTTPPSPSLVQQARERVKESHILRKTNSAVTDEPSKFICDDYRPRVLDLFAGGGSIPLEALRLGCEAHTVELNPLAYVVELCALVYPQKYGAPDSNATGCGTNKTWAGLSKEVQHWGRLLLKKIADQLTDLYPAGSKTAKRNGASARQSQLWKPNNRPADPPIAYLWTRAVECKNPLCKREVPLVRQTWLCRKEGRNVALRMETRSERVFFRVVGTRTEADLKFDPSDFSSAGNATCPFCGTVADATYVSGQGKTEKMFELPMVVVKDKGRGNGKEYLEASPQFFPAQQVLLSRLGSVLAKYGFSLPETTMDAWSGIINPPLHGLSKYRKLFNTRQLIALVTTIGELRVLYDEQLRGGYDADRALGIQLILCAFIDQLADWNSSLSTWIPGGEKVRDALAGPGIGMAWDYVEINPLAGGSGSLAPKLERLVAALDTLCTLETPAVVTRGDATKIDLPRAYFDAVITDPPYYSNLPYSHLSDCVYVWLRLALSDKLPEHFASEKTPKRTEAIASSLRDGNNASSVYESLMTQAFRRAHDALKDSGIFVCVYAHRTTAGWATLVDSIRRAGFTVTEAWPIEMEKKGRLIAIDAAALKSNIFIVARKREGHHTGGFDHDVRPDLQKIVRERIDTLWDMGIAGGDLVIACVGAGLRAFTKYEKVEYPNGEEVPAAQFLTEVETVVLDAILHKLSQAVSSTDQRHSLAGVDPASRFYLLWRYTYRSAELDSGEAIIFANGTHVELEGIKGLATARNALIEKKKGKYKLRDYAGRGGDPNLGMAAETGESAPIIDSLHRTLWLMEHQPSRVSLFLREAQPNLEQMRLVAQALLGPALKGSGLGEVSPTGELGALAKLTANWKGVIAEEFSSTPLGRAARRGE